MTGKTTDPLLGDVFTAAIINQAAGGAIVAPWQVREIPDEWIEASVAATVELAKWKKFKKAGGIDG